MLREELKRTEEYIDCFFPEARSLTRADKIVREMAATKGKRLRPMMLLYAGHFGDAYAQDDGPIQDKLCKLAACVELIHTTSLIHDDIVDDSVIRRGKATIQSKFGKDMAVYAGDLLFGRILEVLAAEGLMAEARLIGQTVQKMCRGEIGQYDCRFKADTPVATYLQNIYGKTVSLFVLAAELGAKTGGCDEKTATLLTQIAEHVGYMFQMRDDLLDFTKEARVTGKERFLDFKDGILTLPVLYALETTAQRKTLKALVGDVREGTFTQESEQALLETVRNGGGLTRTVEVMQKEIDCAMEAFYALPECKAKEAFTKMLDRMQAAVSEATKEVA